MSQSAEATAAGIKHTDAFIHISWGEVRPQGVGKVQLGVGRLPKKEVGYTDVSSGADDHVRVAAVCGVGMGATGSQMQDLRKANALPAAMPVFTLQGGFDLSRLRGIYKLMMTVMVKTAVKGLAEKQDRTPDEDAMLDLMLHGGSRVSGENLTAVLQWYGMKQENMG